MCVIYHILVDGGNYLEIQMEGYRIIYGYHLKGILKDLIWKRINSTIEF